MAVEYDVFEYDNLINHEGVLRSCQPIRFYAAKQHQKLAPVESKIIEKLEKYFKPQHLQVVNESYMHNVPKGSETHFKVVLVSHDFNGIGLVQRHRKINQCLSEELEGGVHALSITAHTSEEWIKNNGTFNKSPPCMGGDASSH
ncbi:DNA-binding transcriptional regulator BolA [Octopus bimaculoides]|uniref:DNA-binding transcriptional regulator BolA n=1 Tax=Octopus bimaculoides TaxID=37653 RepID=UPI00071CA04D|nr:DNA-binding transcriptional regulator BolA [Octopus bimaculoides]|eukprot:XP_014785398.1 PREDICTED: protein BolA homolog [Octopus bimaculoides]